MDAFSDPLIEEIDVISSSQTGKTEALLNCIGYAVDTDPGPMLVVLPDVETSASIFSTERLDKMVRDTPALTDKFAPAKAKSADNNMLHKSFRGGYVAIRGSNSPAGLSSLPIRYLFLDEVSRFKRSAGKEGDPVNLAIKRTQTFWNRKIFMCSTPSIYGICRITAAYEESDMRQFYVPCPDCGAHQVLFFSAKYGDEDQPKKRAGGIKWLKDSKGEHLPETVYYECEHCGYHIHQHQVHEMTLRGEWRASKPFNGKAGFRLNEFYSPWAKWSKIVSDFIEIKRSKDIDRLQVFVNTVLGEAFRESGESVDGLDLVGRREPWPEGKIPNGVLVLTCGIDTQDNRLEYMVWGWGKDEERYAIDYGQFMGDTSKTGEESVYKQLETYLKTFSATREDNAELKIQCTAMDTGGHRTEEVYRFCKQLEYRRVFAIKGESRGDWFVKLSGKKNKMGGTLFRVAVDTGKKNLYDNLKIMDPGAGYVHFPLKDFFDDMFFEQLTSEERVIKWVNNKPEYFWRKKKKGSRNEALDMTVYAHAAKAILKPNYMRLEENIKKQLELKNAQDENPQEVKTSDENKKQKPTPIRNRRPGGWMSGWNL
jgi:phage terminase large subunit GpA-like protein